METESAAEPKDEDNASNRKVWIYVGVATTAIFFFVNDVVGYIAGGGIFSIISALDASTKRTAIIDVDGAGLRTVFMTPVIIIVMVTCAYFRVDTKNRALSVVTMLTMIGVGFVLDGAYDECVVEHVLEARGYTRCENRDHDFGNGKSKVWFDDYVLRRTDCPARRV